MKMRNQVKEIANRGLLSEEYQGQERVCYKTMQHAGFMYKKRIELIEHLSLQMCERGNMNRPFRGLVDFKYPMPL